jgi:hypothetical protein
MKTRSRIVGSVVCILLLLVLSPLVLDEVRSNSITRQIEQAGGFVGSSQPPEWMAPVYDQVCRIDFICKPYQLILEGSAVSNITLSLAGQLKHLHSLELSKATITQEQLTQLKQMRQLKSLEFRDCILPTGGIQQLRKALPEVKVENKITGDQQTPPSDVLRDELEK